MTTTPLPSLADLFLDRLAEMHNAESKLAKALPLVAKEATHSTANGGTIVQADLYAGTTSPRLRGENRLAHHREMRSLLFALGLVAAAVSVTATEPTSRLILGTWKSNREATMASIPPKPNAKPGTQERLAAIFGQMELTFTEHEITMAVPNGGPKGAKPHAYTYSITAEGGKRLVLKTVDKETGATDSMAILFDSDHRFSTPLDPRVGGREYFDRIGK